MCTHTQVLTPVRRSARKQAVSGKEGGAHAQATNATPLLEATNFAYTPNTALTPGAADSPVAGLVMGDGKKLKF